MMLNVKKISSIIVTVIVLIFTASAQETLPNFSAQKLSNYQTQISWKNNYTTLTQLIVQRSFDSTKYFKTIFSTLSPNLPENGFIDKYIAEGYRVYYRIQYVFEDGNYFFTKSKASITITATKAIAKDTISKPTTTIPATLLVPATPIKKATEIIKNKTEIINADTANKQVKPINKNIWYAVYKKNNNTPIAQISENEVKQFKDSIQQKTKDTVLLNTITKQIIISPFVSKPQWKIYKNTRDSLIAKIEWNQVKKFKDSVAKNSKDTLLFNDEINEIVIKTFIPIPIWKPSTFVFIDENNLIKLVFAKAKQRKISIHFFNELGKPILQIDQIKESNLILDKANFRQIGWINFEIYENDVLIEKNKFYLTVD